MFNTKKLLVLTLITLGAFGTSCDDGTENEIKPSGCPVTLDVQSFYSDNQSAEVGVLFQGVDCKGQPTSVNASDLTASEEYNGTSKPLSLAETKANLYPIEKKYKNLVVLSLDTIASITNNATAFSALKSAAKSFASKVLDGNTYLLFSIFDGRQDVFLLGFVAKKGSNIFVNYADAAAAIDAMKCGDAIDGLGNKLCADPSTNLYGSTLAGANLLNQLASYVVSNVPELGGNPLFSKSLVVFTDGTDEANYVSKDQMISTLSSSTYNGTKYFSIGLSGDVNQTILKDIGRDGFFWASDYSQLTVKFDELAATLKKFSSSYKRFAYCTAKRSGMITFKLEHKSGTSISEAFIANAKSEFSCPLGSITNSGGRMGSDSSQLELSLPTYNPGRN
ncbi:MAG: VWA domain-containing protein [Xanthomonadaceae bacterium]|nr:VWA domain-containing protein [Xanthomonadaceae bacterium]